MAALNAAGVTPTAHEVLTPYRQAFRATPQASAVITAMTARARRGRLVGLSQAQIGRRAGVAQNTVSEVVDRLRRLDLVATTGGEYLPRVRRRALLRYRLRWSPVMELSPGRLEQGRICAEELARGRTPYEVRRLLVGRASATIGS
jgi:DNA-binding MarR family transcriptional regulator